MKPVIKASTPELQNIQAVLSAHTRLIAFTLALWFWLSVALFLLFLRLFDVISWGLSETVPQVYQVLQLLALIGLSPIVLASISQKVFEKACVYFLNKYKDRYMKSNN